LTGPQRARTVPASRPKFEPQRRVPKTLRADKDLYPAPLSARESYVKIGDLVQEVSER
jgi:hypothetical protein